MEERELFKNVIDQSLKMNDMVIFCILVASLITADNNVTEKEIKKNCKSIQILIDILNDYPSNDELQKTRQQLIQYNKIYSK